MMRLDNLECPNCGANLCNEENVTELCGEPFNGTIIDCDDCEIELSLNLYATIEVL